MSDPLAVEMTVVAGTCVYMQIRHKRGCLLHSGFKQNGQEDNFLTLFLKCLLTLTEPKFMEIPSQQCLS